MSHTKDAIIKFYPSDGKKKIIDNSGYYVIVDCYGENLIRKMMNRYANEFLSWIQENNINVQDEPPSKIQKIYIAHCKKLQDNANSSSDQTP